MDATDDTTMSRRSLFRVSAAGAAAATGLAAGTGSVTAQYDGWLDNVPNYDGTHDYTGQDEVTVTVGAGNGLVFGPSAILIDPGTTVVWEWSGEGGAHNVVANDETFDSGETVNEAGHTFEHTFEDVSEGDTFNYLCTPHEAAGMKGAVAIGSVDDNLVTPGSGGNGGDGSDGDADGADGGSDRGSSSGGEGTGTGGEGSDSDGGDGDRDLSASDIGALALGFGFAGALLVPLFYAAHQMASDEE
ncbi:halocyanin domain-containing protein [Halorubrum laminariae]|uniref:Halocyanin domain-containing protein n=1 Tax=Halorubrum laminariae TaxID=1433523 RepID=A0ABD6C2Q1_9EURY|nr:halocyanin domain-containing protein [Halorubrum laminariae]